MVRNLRQRSWRALTCLTSLLSLTIPLSLTTAACGTNQTATTEDVETAPDTLTDDTAPDIIAPADIPDTLPEEDTVPPPPRSAGRALDERIPTELVTDFAIPQAFYDALEEMNLPLSKLVFPDIGLTADWDMSRLHWTDMLRHQGETGPLFTYFLVEHLPDDQAPPDEWARDLVALQGMFMARDQFLLSRYDLALTEASTPAALLAALRDWYETPSALDAAQRPPWSELEATLAADIEDLPTEALAPLALAVRGLTEAARLRDLALLHKGVYDLAAWEGLRTYFVNYSSMYTEQVYAEAQLAIDWELMNRAAQVATRATESLRLHLNEIPPSPGAGFELEGPLGLILVDLDDNNDERAIPDGFLVVDRAGDDTWLGGAGAADSARIPVSVLLDVEGSDLYDAPFDWELDIGVLGGRVPMQGSGLFGVGLLVDGAGDDVRRCPSVCQGHGIFGAGILLDHGGADSYAGYDLSQGAAEFGFGLLADRGQDSDTYEILQRGLGYGGPRGMGWVLDEGGDDRFEGLSDPIILDWANEGANFTGGLGFGFGYRGGPYFSGGLGALLDLGGDDEYRCSVMCMAFGYFFGTGLLYDADGDDSYTVTHKYAIGAATHQSVGLFVDGGGADAYRNTGDDECIGLGYDHGVAWHLDLGLEPDVYTIDNKGDFTIGFARHPAMGVLINEGGDDTYNIPGSGQRSLGRSEVNPGDRNGPAFNTISLGLFLDLGGTADTYNVDRPEATNNNTWRQTEDLGGAWNPNLDFGLGVDSE